MKISSLIVLLGVIAAFVVALLTFNQGRGIQESQAQSFNAVNTSLYETAWNNKSDQSWADYLDRYNPDGFSKDYEGIFTSDSEVSDEPGFIFKSIVGGSYEDARQALDDFFYFELDDGNLSFVMIYDLQGDSIYCGYSSDFPVGVDPCSSSAKADFQDDLVGFLSKTVRSKRQIIRVDDLQGVSTSTLNQSLIFPIKGEDRKPIGVAIMGRNVFANLELFEEEYNVRTAISAADVDISLEDYGISDEGSYSVQMFDLLAKAKELLTRNVASQTASDNGLRHSMTSLPLSAYSSSGIGKLVIFTNQEEIFAELEESENMIYIFWAASMVLIVGVLAGITQLAFSGILKSIEVLNALTEQQQSNQRFEEVEMPSNSGVIAAITSKESEVPQLIAALSSYKQALLSNRQASRENRERRLQRDDIIADKMRVLADQLEGEAKESMLQDVAKLQAIDENATEEERETQSVELMSTAFSKMSDDVNDLIELKTSDAVIARDEAMDAKEQTGRFFNNMSHELRTPLNAIIGYSEILYEDCEDEGYDDLMPDLKKITNSGKHLLELVNEILDIGKIQSGKMEFFPKSFDLGETLDMVRDISSPLADKNSNKFIIDLPDALPSTMYTDEGKLRQNLTNILSNAFKFTQSGTITLSVSESVVDGTDMVVFTINDTGQGMTPDFLDTIFDEYSQQQGTSSSNIAEMQKSTGLGMAILAKYVEMAGGTVRVESELGVGSTFFMTMPRRYDDGTSEEEGQDELSKAIQSLKSDSFVVMIDDDKNMHDVAKRTLGKAGINVIGAMDGETGLNIIRDNKPSLILLDVYMPGRQGWSILSEIKADPDLKDIPVCMVTQLNEEDYAKSLGANGYFTKPIDRETFVTEVLKLLDTQEGDNQTILVVDDDANTRDLLTRILSEEGFDAQTAKDGIDGLEKLDHLTAVSTSPSLIVLDISMPRMDGFQFLEAYSKKVATKDHVPIIIFSGKDMSLTQREMLNNFENVIGIFAKGDLPNLASFIQRHREDDTSEGKGSEAS